MSTQTLFRNDSQQDDEQQTRTSEAASARSTGHPTTLLAVRLLAAAALLVSAYLHLTLAIENGLGGQPFTMSQLFIGQAVASASAAGLLLVNDREPFWLPALAVAIGSTIPILASVYFPLPGIGPLPPINEPVWYGEKILSLAVGVTVPLLWLIRRIAPPTPDVSSRSRAQKRPDGRFLGFRRGRRLG